MISRRANQSLKSRLDSSWCVCAVAQSSVVVEFQQSRKTFEHTSLQDVDQVPKSLLDWNVLQPPSAHLGASLHDRWLSMFNIGNLKPGTPQSSLYLSKNPVLVNTLGIPFSAPGSRHSQGPSKVLPWYKYSVLIQTARRLHLTDRL